MRGCFCCARSARPLAAGAPVPGRLRLLPLPRRRSCVAAARVCVAQAARAAATATVCPPILGSVACTPLPSARQLQQRRRRGTPPRCEPPARSKDDDDDDEQQNSRTSSQPCSSRTLASPRSDGVGSAQAEGRVKGEDRSARDADRPEAASPPDGLAGGCSPTLQRDGAVTAVAVLAECPRGWRGWPPCAVRFAGSAAWRCAGKGDALPPGLLAPASAFRSTQRQPLVTLALTARSRSDAAGPSGRWVRE